MLDFAIIGLPRSGTTWAANWLTTDRSLCLHDPLINRTLDQLAQWRSPGKVCGVACTALWQFPEWVSKNVRRVILVDRALSEVNKSLTDIGLGEMPTHAVEQFLDMAGSRIDMASLFDPVHAPDVWCSLLPEIDFDAERHELLTGFMVNPYFAGWEPDPAAVKDWVIRLQEAASK